MGKSVGTDQSHAIIATLQTTVDWEALDGDLLQENIIRNPTEAGRHFTLYLRNGGRMPLGDFKIAAIPFDPVVFSGLGEGWQINEQDERSLALKEIDFAKVTVIHCLRGEPWIEGEENLRRLKERSEIRVDARFFMGLWRDYQANDNKKNSLLERLYQAGILKCWQCFPGTILLGPDGARCVPCLYRNDDGKWYWNVGWLGYVWRVDDLSAVSSQV